MKIILAVLIVWVFMCSFAISAFTQNSAQGNSGNVVFNQRCAGCHPNGGNIVNPNKPLKGSQTLNTFETFLLRIRKPNQPMPPFPSATISDQEAQELYAYILKETRGSWK